MTTEISQVRQWPFGYRRGSACGLRKRCRLVDDVWSWMSIWRANAIA